MSGTAGPTEAEICRSGCAGHSSKKGRARGFQADRLSQELIRGSIFSIRSRQLWPAVKDVFVHLKHPRQNGIETVSFNDHLLPRLAQMTKCGRILQHLDGL